MYRQMYLGEVWPESFPGRFGEKEFPGDLLSLPLDVCQILPLVLLQVEGNQFRDSQDRAKQDEQNGVVAHRLLIGPGVEMDQLFGGRLEPVDLDVLQSAPFRILDRDRLDSLAGVTSQERPLRVEPRGRVLQSGQHSIDGGGSQPGLF